MSFDYGSSEQKQQANQNKPEHVSSSILQGSFFLGMKADALRMGKQEREQAAAMAAQSGQPGEAGRAVLLFCTLACCSGYGRLS